MKEISDKIFDTAREALIVINEDYTILNANYSFLKKPLLKEKTLS